MGSEASKNRPRSTREPNCMSFLKDITQISSSSGKDCTCNECQSNAESRFDQRIGEMVNPLHDEDSIEDSWAVLGTTSTISFSDESSGDEVIHEIDLVSLVPVNDREDVPASKDLPLELVSDPVDPLRSAHVRYDALTGEEAYWGTLSTDGVLPYGSMVGVY